LLALAFHRSRVDVSNHDRNGTAKTASKVNGFRSDGIVAAQDVDVTNDEIDDGDNQMEEGIAFAAVHTPPRRGLGESGINPDAGAIPPLASFPDALLGIDQISNAVSSKNVPGHLIAARPRRNAQKPYDVLVLRRLLYRALRRATPSATGFWNMTDTTD